MHAPLHRFVGPRVTRRLQLPTAGQAGHDAGSGAKQVSMDRRSSAAVRMCRRAVGLKGLAPVLRSRRRLLDRCRSGENRLAQVRA